MEFNRYQKIDADLVKTKAAQHRNGDKTYVFILDTDEEFLAIAAETDQSGEPMGSELLFTAFTEDEATTRAERWLDDNPKGIEGGGGLGSLLGS